MNYLVYSSWFRIILYLEVLFFSLSQAIHFTKHNIEWLNPCVHTNCVTESSLPGKQINGGYKKKSTDTIRKVDKEEIICFSRVILSLCDYPTNKESIWHFWKSILTNHLKNYNYSYITAIWHTSWQFCCFCILSHLALILNESIR